MDDLLQANAALENEKLAAKVQQVFGPLAIDKRRLPESQLQKRGVPAYVGEWVLDTIVPGTGKLNEDESRKIHSWANKYLPGPGDTNIIKNRLLNGEAVKVLTPLEVEVVLTQKIRMRVGKLKLLGLSDALISDELVEQNKDLLRQGMWGVVQLVVTQKGLAVESFKPMQASVNLDLFKEARREFSLTEWRNLMLTSMGYHPPAFNEDEITLLLCRLLPLVQKNMHVLELAPKGTGKSYVYENISPQVRLVSGGNVSPAVLFVNNASGQWGLLARYSVVVLDEVQTMRFEKPEEIVGGLKGYLANGKLTRGGMYETGSDCGLVMLANIMLDSEQQPIVEPLVRELPEFLQETAFLDRLKGLIPGWKVRKLSGVCFARSVGLKSDFFGDALVALRDDLEQDQHYARRIELTGGKVYKRNEDAVRSIASGLAKIMFPHGEVSDVDFEYYCVRPAVQMRQLIWEQLWTLDAEYRQYDSEISYKIVSDQE